MNSSLIRIGLLILASLVGDRAFAAEAKRPNILIIFSDDHAYQAMSAYHDPRNLIQTPGIDRLANEGMRFDRCLVTNSICGPSRATLLTGKYSHLNGFPNNSNSRFDGSQQTFPKLLQAAGYQTAIIGKWHLGSDPTGFDHWQILPGQGVYYHPPMIRDGQHIEEPGYVTDIITQRSLEWLKQRDKSKPFLLMTQHKAPHREWEPAVRNLNFDHDRVYPEPATLFDNYANRGLAVRDQDMTIARTMNDRDTKLEPPQRLTPEERTAWDAYYNPRNEAFRTANPQGDDLVRWKYQRYMHDYLATVKGVDDSVAEVLKYLDDEGLAENTIVVYASDQGFYLGEHGWFDKRWIFEESIRTPCLVRWPGVVKPGSVNGNLVSLLDLAETFLDAAGVPTPADMQGKSLVPILKGTTPPDWRKSFYYHYYEYPVPHHVRPHYGVVTDRYKLVHFYAPDVDYWELYDLEMDPDELRSVYGQPGYAAVEKDLHTELNRLRKELKVPDPDPPGYSGGKVGEAAAAPKSKAASLPAAAPVATKPNIVMIVADDLGYSDLGCYGSEVSTPNLDRLAANGLRFTQFYNAARCCPSRASMLTGLYPHQTGVGHMLGDWKLPGYTTGLNEHCATIAELLHTAGYLNYHVGKWHVGGVGAKQDPRNHPINRGFDHAWGTGGGGSHFNLPVYDDLKPTDWPVGGYSSNVFTDHAVEYLEEHARDHQGAPFFLHLCYTAPHFPLHALPEDIAKYRGKFRDGWDAMRARRIAKQKELGIMTPETVLSPRDPVAKAWDSVSENEKDEWDLRYAVHAAMIECMDRGIGKVFETLRKTGVAENTLVVFFSDNGASAEYLDSWPNPARGHKPGSEVGTPESHRELEIGWANAANTPFRENKMWTQEGGISTPFLAAWPTGISAHGAITRQVGHIIDLVPTFLELAGVTYPATLNGRELTPLEGKSLVPVLRGGTIGDRTLAWEHEGNRAIRVGDWKLVATYKEPWELFDLSHDRSETRNLITTDPDRAKDLAAQWQKWADRIGVVPWEQLPGSKYKPTKGYRRKSEPVDPD